MSASEIVVPAMIQHKTSPPQLPEAAHRMKAAQANFMEALGSIADAHSALVSQFEKQQRLGEIWSEAYSQDVGELYANVQRIEARIAEAHSAEARIADIGNKLEMRLDAVERQQLAQTDDTMSQLNRKHEDFSRVMKQYCDKAITEVEERARVHARKLQESSEKRSENVETWVRESIEAQRGLVESKLQECNDSLTSQVQEASRHVASCHEKVNPFLARISDIENLATEQRNKYERLAESLERFAMASQIPPMEMRIRSTERDLAKLSEKHVASEASLLEGFKGFKEDLAEEAEARKAVDLASRSRAEMLDKLIEDFKERVRTRCEGLQDDIGASREWAVKRLEAHAEILRSLNTEQGNTLVSRPEQGTDGTSHSTKTVATALPRGAANVCFQTELAELQGRVNEFICWRNDIDRFQKDFSRQVESVQQHSQLVEDKTGRLVAMEQHIQEMMQEAQRVLDFHMACTTKCLSCGRTAAARAAAVDAHPRSLSPPDRRSLSPRPHEAEPTNCNVHAVAHALVAMQGSSASSRATSSTKQPSVESVWPQAPGHGPRSRPGSAKSRNSDRSHIVSTATSTPISTTPAGGGFAVTRARSTSSSRRPQSATARLGDTAKKSIACSNGVPIGW